MKRGAKVALSGVICALSLMLMLCTFLPTLNIALPALAGVVLTVLVIECGKAWGFTAYVAVSLLSLLLAPALESRLLFICLFGYYPILKALLERIGNRFLCWLAKLAVFNVAVIAAYFLLIRFTTAVDPVEFTLFGMYMPGVVLLLGNGTFLLYDIALTRLITMYLQRWQPHLHKWLH